MDNDIVAIYPNPFDDLVNISFKNENATIEIEVHDISGRLLFSQVKSTQETYELRLSGLTSGVYFVRIKINDIFQKRILIKK